MVGTNLQLLTIVNLNGFFESRAEKALETAARDFRLCLMMDRFLIILEECVSVIPQRQGCSTELRINGLLLCEVIGLQRDLEFASRFDAFSRFGIHRPLYIAVLGLMNRMAKIEDCLSPFLVSKSDISKGRPIVSSSWTSSFHAKLICPKDVRLTLEILDTTWQPGRHSLGPRYTCSSGSLPASDP